MNRESKKQEGIHLSSNLDFGEAKPFSEFKPLIILRETMYDADFYFYYRVTQDCYIQIANGLEDKNHRINIQFRRTEIDFTAQVLQILKQYIEQDSFYDGYLKFVKGSSVITKRDYSEMIESLKLKTLLKKEEALKNRSKFIDYLEENDFNPRETGNTKYSWTAGCPNFEATRFHSLMVSTLNDEWGCSYCKRKGNQKDFEKWVMTIKYRKSQRELTKFLLELKIKS